MMCGITHTHLTFMRYQGRITRWNDDKGFGFITPNGGGAQVFLHINAFSGRQLRPVGDELVTYELAVDDKGRAQARTVAYVGTRVAPPRTRGRSKLPFVIAFGFLLLIGAAVHLGRLPAAVLMLYSGASLIAFIAYAIDKSAAQRDQWRTRESTLHLFALIGGWPGALLAQRLLRHKSTKPSFQTTFWITVVLNCGALGWLLSPAGANMLRTIPGI